MVYSLGMVNTLCQKTEMTWLVFSLPSPFLILFVALINGKDFVFMIFSTFSEADSSCIETSFLHHTENFYQQLLQMFTNGTIYLL